MSWTSNKLYRHLNGLMSLYKPKNTSIKKFGDLVQYYISKGFNELPTENVRIRTEVLRLGNETKIVTLSDIMSLPKVTGPSFYSKDFEMYLANPLPEFASGVQVVGIGPVGLSLSSKMFEENMYMSVYRLTCMMGRSTFSGTSESHTLLRTTWKHVREGKLQFILKNQVEEYMSLSYLSAGFTPNSEAAFKAMSQNSGLLRPKPISENDRDNCDQVNRPIGIIYGLSCVAFEPPLFTIEMHVINENIDFIIKYIKELGARLKTAVVLTKMRRIRQGRFTVEDSLLLKRLKYFDPDIIAAHMDMTNEKHSFEDLQMDDRKETFINDGSKTIQIDGGNNKIKSLR